MISVVSLDLGHVLPNNPFLDSTIMTRTLEPPFPDGIQILGDGTWNTTISELSLPANVADFEAAGFSKGNSSYINGEYQCRFWYPIGWGESALGARLPMAEGSLCSTSYGECHGRNAESFHQWVESSHVRARIPRDQKT